MTPSIYQKAEIVSGWEAVSQKTHQMVAELSAESFLRKPENYWSVAGHYQHLILSLEPLAKALGAPKMVLKPFGKPNRPTRTFEEVFQRYHERLAAAPASISSGFAAKDGEELIAEDMHERWIKASERFLKGISKWDEEDLDKYLMPHPLLGKLVVREMLFFTIFHTQHHLKRMEETIAGLRA